MHGSYGNSGIGLLPDRAWTSTRYACSGHGHRESAIISILMLSFFNFELI